MTFEDEHPPRAKSSATLKPRKRLPARRPRKRLPDANSLDASDTHTSEDFGIESFSGSVVGDEIELGDFTGFDVPGKNGPSPHVKPVDPDEFEISENAPSKTVEEVIMEELPEKERTAKLLAGRERTTQMINEAFARKNPGKARNK